MPLATRSIVKGFFDPLSSSKTADRKVCCRRMRPRSPRASSTSSPLIVSV